MEAEKWEVPHKEVDLSNLTLADLKALADLSVHRMKVTQNMTVYGYWSDVKLRVDRETKDRVSSIFGPIPDIYLCQS